MLQRGGRQTTARTVEEYATGGPEHPLASLPLLSSHVRVGIASPWEMQSREFESYLTRIIQVTLHELPGLGLRLTKERRIVIREYWPRLSGGRRAFTPRRTAHYATSSHPRRTPRSGGPWSAMGGLQCRPCSQGAFASQRSSLAVRLPRGQ